MKYTPRYDDKAIKAESDEINISGKSARDNVRIEEAAQRKVAEKWYIAQKHLRVGDSQPALEKLGFTNITPVDALFYEVTPPDGWTKDTEGYWTTVKDETGKERISQFFKGAWYDTEAFMSIYD